MKPKSILFLFQHETRVKLCSLSWWLMYAVMCVPLFVLYKTHNFTSELAVHLRLSLNSYRLPNCSPLFTKGLSYLAVLCGLLSIWYYSCRGCTDYLQYLSCCGGGSSSYWHHYTCCWSPGWCPDGRSPVLLHQQAPIPELQAWDVLSPTAAAGNSTTAASWSRVWGGSWTERERGLWSSTEYWTEAMWSLCACAALIVTNVSFFRINSNMSTSEFCISTSKFLWIA